MREGDFRGDVIAIEFPDREHAIAWYESSDYQAILPLRRNNSTGWTILLDGVEEDHRATDVLPVAEPAHSDHNASV